MSTLSVKHVLDYTKHFPEMLKMAASDVMTISCQFWLKAQWREGEKFLRSIPPDAMDEQSWTALAVFCASQYKVAESEIFARKAIACDSSYFPAHGQLAIALLRSGRIAEALDAINEACALEGGLMVLVNIKANILQMGGSWKEWARYSCLFESSRPAPPGLESTPLWKGEALDGRCLLVTDQQGFGDTLQHSRFVPMLAGKGGRILFRVRRELFSFLQGMSGKFELVSRHDPVRRHDFRVSLYSLPYYVETNSVPPPPLISSWAEKQFPLPPRREKHLRVGVSWAGHPKFSEDAIRSATIAEFLPIFRVSGCEFFSLQMAPKITELEALPQDVSVFDCGSGITEFADTASIMKQMDLVICTDSATAHLAGTLGIPVWILLSAIPDPRWGWESDQTSWYPSALLFRQKVLGDWRAPISKIADALRLIVSVQNRPTLPVFYGNQTR